MKETKSDSTAGPFSTALRAFRYRNYRLFFFGQGVSLVGTWMQSVAASWMVYRITGSPLALGLVAFAGQAPAFFVSPFAGVLNDRWNRHRALVIVQYLAMAQALLMTALAFSGHAALWNILALGLFLGMINAFEMPTRQALVIELIGDKNDLGNAIALNSALFNGTRLIGPAIAGVIVALYGEGICFAVNAASYCAAIAAFSSMRLNRTVQPAGKKNMLAELKEGAVYAAGFTPIRDILILLALNSLVGMSFPVLLPVYAAKVLGGGSGVFGSLVAASGLGATVGTVYLAMRRSVRGLVKVIIAGMFIFGTGLLAFSYSTSYHISLALISLVGFGMIVNIASCNTVLQTIVDEKMRGRVTSFYIMSFMGTAPLGSLLAGTLSDSFGVPLAVRTGAVICLAGAVIFSMRAGSIRRLIRPIYRQKGIIPEVAAGIETAEVLQEPPENPGS